uniref:Uncharacterized protein n=1 Tax=Manihot esculenta TaxID=3983 RepID=A0A199UAX7_MANES
MFHCYGKCFCCSLFRFQNFMNIPLSALFIRCRYRTFLS